MPSLSIPICASVVNWPDPGTQAIGHEFSEFRSNVVPTSVQVPTVFGTEDTVIGDELPFTAPTMMYPETWPGLVWKFENVMVVGTDPEPPPLKVPKTMRW